jgi:hypothetical protein
LRYLGGNFALLLRQISLIVRNMTAGPSLFFYRLFSVLSHRLGELSRLDLAELPSGRRKGIGMAIATIEEHLSCSMR